MAKDNKKSVKIHKKLISLKKKSFDGDYEATIVEQWKTCVETANSITEKRNNANSIFITINTALFTVVTFTLDLKSVFLSLIGILICVLWLMLLNNYLRLNEVKYKIINEIEEMLPLAPFNEEWKRLHLQGKYTGLTKIEKFIPRVFIFLYSLALLYPIIEFMLPLICPCFNSNS